jgi:hypothetical protein
VALVQTKQGSTTSSTLTITLDAPTTAGTALVVLVAASGTTSNPTSVSGITLGGAADNFAQVSTFGSSSDAAIGATWLDLNCAGGQTSVAITVAGGTGTLAVMASVYEWSGLYPVSPFDQTANSVSGGSTSWTSAATPTTTQATEVWFGAVFTTASTAGTITGPGSPWTNLTQVSQTQGSFEDRWMSGYQVVSSTGTATYSGTVSPSSQWIAKVATFRLDTGGPYTQTFSASGTWQAPAGVTSVKAECWGGGGTGGMGTGNPAEGGGGAGGAYARKNAYPVTSGNTYTVTVGAATGAHNTTSVVNGNDSWFDNNTTGVLAKGGAGGVAATVNSTNGAGGTGSTTGCIGDVVFAGGSGAAGVFATSLAGGAGGGGAGDANAGGAASGNTGGTGGTSGGGAGANGVADSTAGAAGTAPGGGGSGGDAASTTDRNGGGGAAGRVILTWDIDTPVPHPVRGPDRRSLRPRRAGFTR